MDRVVYGGNGAKMAYIISERYEEITAKLLERLHRRKWWDYTGKIRKKRNRR